MCHKKTFSISAQDCLVNIKAEGLGVAYIQGLRRHKNGVCFWKALKVYAFGSNKHNFLVGCSARRREDERHKLSFIHCHLQLGPKQGPNSNAPQTCLLLTCPFDRHDKPLSLSHTQTCHLSQKCHPVSEQKSVSCMGCQENLLRCSINSKLSLFRRSAAVSQDGLMESYTCRRCRSG